MTESLEKVEESINRPLWIIGFYPIPVIGGMTVLGYYIGRNNDYLATGEGVLAGLAIGSVVWFIGRRHVGEWYESVIGAFQANTKNRVRDILGYGEDTETYCLKATYSSPLSVVPDRKCDISTLVIGESSLAVHDAATMNLPWFEEQIENSTREFYFDQIVSVDYDEPDLQVKVSDGELVQYQSSIKPNDVLYTLQDRLRNFKNGS